MMATLSPAPFKDMRTGVKINPEATEAQKEASQRFERVTGEVGKVPVRTENNDIPVSEFDASAKDAVRAARPSNEEDPQAKEILQQTAVRLKQEGRSPVNTFFLGFLMLGLGFGVVFGAKTWVDRQIPESPKPKRVTW